MAGATPALDRGAAVTRSLLGWGVVAGPFYVVLGLVLALTRPGFDLSRHALSLLTLGEYGWLHRTNLVLTGLMVVAAGIGVLRAIRNGRGLAMGVLLALDGLCLVLSAVFLPDPVAGFPPGSAGGNVSTSGLLHLLCGGLGFLAMSAAAVTHWRWSSSQGLRGAPWSLIAGIVILVAFLAGAALATSPVGILLIWVSVLAQWTWLAFASGQVYSWSPHPLGARQAEPAAP